MECMTRREVAFLLIGIGSGLILADVAIVQFILWFHHMFILGITWRPASALLALPILVVLAGALLLYRGKPKQKPT
jgi:hypothetical protein